MKICFFKTQSARPDVKAHDKSLEEALTSIKVWEKFSEEPVWWRACLSFFGGKSKTFKSSLEL